MVSTKKKKSGLSAFFTTSPLKTGASILLIVSVLLNLGVLVFIVLLKHTAKFDLALVHYTLNKTCQEDYQEVLQIVADKSVDPEAQKKFFAAGVCFRDYKTGKPIDIKSIKPLQ